MDVNFRNVQIKGILTVLPEKKIIDNSGTERYCVKDTSYTTDLFVYGVNTLLRDKLEKKDIGAIVTASFTPDYITPQLSFRVHGALDLPEDILCTDLIEENSSYIKGLLDSMLIAEHMPDKKVLFLCGNISDKRKNDTVPFYGNDGAAITVIQRSEQKNIFSLSCSIDESHIDDIKMHSCGFYDLFHEKGNLYTNNTETVSKLMQEKIPEIITRLVKNAKVSIEDIDFFSIPKVPGLSIQKIADELGIRYESIAQDDSGMNCSIINPLHITEGYKRQTVTDQTTCLLIGYGAGINYGGAVLELKGLEFCDTIYSDL